MIGHRPARAASRRWFQPLPLLLVPSTLLALVLGLCLGLGLDARTAGADALREAFLTVREGNANDANIGASVGTAGDVNGDGYSDVLLNSRENNGTVRCYLGGRDLDFSAPAWTATGGAQPNAWLGCRVSTAGDVNGDGYDDVLIGAPIYSDGQSSEGAVFVYLGSSSGLSPTPHKVLQQDVALAGFGSSVDTAGDVNGDGYDDVVVGAPNYGSGQAQEGRVYVYLGSSSGMHAQPSWSFESNVSGAYLGQRVAGSADVNADGYDDLLVSAPDLANGQASEGRVYLFLGSPSGLGAGPAWTYESNTAGGRCGWGLGCAGDVNADGYSDIVFDTGSNNPATGAVLIFFGGPNVPGAVANRVFPSNQGAFGDVIYTAGDVNGDGSSDLIASEVSANNFTGRITILGGSETAAAPPVLALRDGQQAEEAFATDARPAGDVNGDGYGDVIVGAPRFESGPVHIDEGIVRLYLGQATAPASQPAWFPMGVQWNAQYGAAVAQGDWNGDGLTDLAFGAPWYDVEETDCGAVTIYYGNEAGYTVAANQFLSGEIENELLGFSLANAGDVDNDGYDDLVVGAPSYGSLDWPNVGAAFLYKGSATGLSGTPSWSVSGGILPCQFGWSVSGAGDVNSDGFADVIVGAPQYSFSPEVGGKAFLFFGSASGLSYVTAWTGSGNADGDAYGSSVAGIGDVNGDGYGDIAVGSPGLDDGQTDEGAFHVFFGSPEGIEGSWTVEGNANFVQYGYEVAAGGDLNGDGLSDLLHGAPFFDGDGLINCGIAEAYLGTPGNTLTRVWQQRGGSTGDFYGYSLAGGGDANDDGYSDVLVGAPTAAGTRGECYLYLGQAGGLGAAPVWGANGGDPAGSFGTGLSIAGDVTGDGFADLVVSEPNYQAGYGKGYCFYGSRDGLPPSENGGLRHPRQWRADGSTPIALLGASDSPTGFVLGGVARSAKGRSTVELRYETAPAGSPWDGAAPESGGFYDTGVPIPSVGSAVLAKASCSGLAIAEPYRWRVRFDGDSPFFPHSPWFSVPGNAAGESDVRMGGQPATVDDGQGQGAGAGAGHLALRFSRVGPNPCYESATLGFVLPANGRVRLTVHDVSGRRVATLFDGEAQAGQHAAGWDTRDEQGRPVPAGIYLVRLDDGSASIATKVIVNRR